MVQDLVLTVLSLSHLEGFKRESNFCARLTLAERGKYFMLGKYPKTPAFEIKASLDLGAISTS